MGMNTLSHPSHHRSWVEVDLPAIADNVRFFQELAGPARIVMPALKADAYGHGLVESARAALAGGAGRIAVATCLEGQQLREAGIGVPIQVLGASFPEEVNNAVRFNLTMSLHDIEIARLIALAAIKERRTVPVHFKIDTGMGRLGVLPENAVEAAREICSMPGLQFEGVFMHFAEADNEEYSRYQLERFNTACAGLEEAGITGFLRHAANTAAALLYPESRFDLIRPGCGVYGFLSPSWLAEKWRLAPALSWRSAIIQIKDYPAGRCLGYNRTFTTKRETRVAVLPVGYADGYRREFSNCAEVLIRGRRAPVVGTISMDYAIVDITDLHEEDIDVGTVATLLGADRGDRITVEEMAEWIGTIPYCLTTGLGTRVGRDFVPLGDL